MSPLAGQTVLVLGLGQSGLAMACWCARGGAVVRVWDSRLPAPGVPDPQDIAPQVQALRERVPQAVWCSGELGEAQLDGVARVLKSPGLAPHDARIAPLLQAARERGTAVQGELDLFVEALAELKAERGYAPHVLAVTGTNGKTTTTALTALLVERAGRRVVAAGNIGPTLLDTLSQALDQAALPGDAAQPLPEVWVLELSSFQLDAIVGFEPDAATVLNLSQDHLDWHGTMDAYAQAKARIFGTHALMVVNRDDERVRSMVPRPPGAVAAVPAKPAAIASIASIVPTASIPPVGRRAKVPKFVPRRVCEFGLGAPLRPGEFGLVEQGGMAWLVRAWPLEGGLKPHKGEDSELQLQLLMPADALRIRGRHNAANALAALALATSIGLPLAPMLHALRDYRGEAHRVASVAVVDGIEAFDDSKGTNVGATVAALEGLGAERQPGKLVVILGGDGKGQDFAPLLAPLQRHARALALIGRDAAAIESLLLRSGLVTQRHDSLEAATAWCFEQALPGDAVLLSPACASLDMFRNYAHRAEVFVAAVHRLAAERGEVVA